jgi:membrane associated rhomboid family serine protease
MLPLKDINPTRRFPLLTYAIIAINILVFLWELSFSPAQVAIDPTSTIVLVGASGAIAGVLGSYFILFPSVRVKGIVPLSFVNVWSEWPAWLVIGLWFVVQLFNGIASVGVETGGGGVAFFAHIGGFVCGLILTRLMMIVYPQPPVSERQEMLYQRARHTPAF